mmetsp:Transcript_41845/g.119400  ORF Transcript_41845/g.119400 Transcript_41845/m.119400 type:complete len:250 (+) Transcript_41845:152-901(+)
MLSELESEWQQADSSRTLVREMRVSSRLSTPRPRRATWPSTITRVMQLWPCVTWSQRRLTAHRLAAGSKCWRQGLHPWTGRWPVWRDRSPCSLGNELHKTPLRQGHWEQSARWRAWPRASTSATWTWRQRRRCCPLRRSRASGAPTASGAGIGMNSWKPCGYGWTCWPTGGRSTMPASRNFGRSLRPRRRMRCSRCAPSLAVTPPRSGLRLPRLSTRSRGKPVRLSGCSERRAKQWRLTRRQSVKTQGC